ncbi:MAG: RNA pseudouridine synthase [Betaproteobacteria bacterium RIFCSPLOWO2_02_FULL_66_14]|nr:MAG: RNA pseudouridine synthase [Betaproteobacteria bacterium RIFCSPLOWO2_02_FULL_66_14]
MKELRNASLLEVDAESAAQRVDNFLLRHLKGVPKSHVYRVLRSGQVRVNSGRVKPDYRLKAGDRVRLPPLRLPAPSQRPAARPLALPVVFEDAALLVIDKPSGVAVHGGSGVSFGVIESLRVSRPQAKFLELAHRLDRDTSGLLVIAKRRSALVELHRMLREGEMEKTYVAAVRGRWRGGARDLDQPLHKHVTAGGERRVSVHDDGMRALTRVRPLAVSERFSLLEVRLLTGRTHQIRVHLAHAGHPVIGDDKYGDFELNRTLAKEKGARLMLHAHQLAFAHPVTKSRVALEAPWPDPLRSFFDRVTPSHAR